MSSNVTIDAGALRGEHRSGVTSFLGVPYAAGLTDQSRLLPPVPVPPWDGERDATTFGPTVPQNGYAAPYSELFIEPAIEGDDSLNLNIWTPDTDGVSPVLVWIHGGAFAHGSGSVPQYDGTGFARSGVVCVTINYRLGIEGFLELGDEHANIGLLDQLAALRWVQANIAKFGGDPTRVTVAGQSAGAMSIGALLSSPLADGLFRAAILQSGAAHHVLPAATAKVVGDHLAEQLGIPATREAFSSVPTERLLEELATLERAIQTTPDFARWGVIAANMMPMEPVVDGTVVTQAPLGSVAEGSAREIPLLVGTNSDENLLFMAPSGVISFIDEPTLRGAVAGYGFMDVDGIVDLYQDPEHPTPGETLAALATDWMFRIPAIRLAEAQQQGGGESYMYEFAWPSPAREGILRASHSMELPFVFDSLDSDGADLLTGPVAPQELADEMHRAWVRFVTDGEPGWAPYTTEQRAVRVFNTTSTTTEDPRGDRRSAWTGLR